MTTLTAPSFKRRLDFVQSELAELATDPVSEFPPEVVQWCLEILPTLSATLGESHKKVREQLAKGVEARLLIRAISPLLPGCNETVDAIQKCLQWLSQREDEASARIAAQLRLLDQQARTHRDLVAHALSKASEPPRAPDLDRIRAAEEAYARGETKVFSRQ
jgi:hypothetical protein